MDKGRKSNSSKEMRAPSSSMDRELLAINKIIAAAEQSLRNSSPAENRLLTEPTEKQETANLLERNRQFDLYKQPIPFQLKRMSTEFLALEHYFHHHSNFKASTSLSMMRLNRYSNILANEDSLFPPLPEDKKGELLYINGNRVKLDLDKSFVASQAPVVEGFGNFYETLIRYNISLILMLTEVVESDILKASPYWPSPSTSEKKPMRHEKHLLWRDESVEKNYYLDTSTSLQYTHFHVQRVNVRGEENSFSDNPSEMRSSQRVQLIQYVGWPDFGVPTSLAGFEALLRAIDAYTSSGPILVHCSAGVGRTATLIGCYAGLYSIRRGLFTNNTVLEVVTKLRCSRWGSVQRVEQYFFIYQVLMNSLGLPTKELSEEIYRRIEATQANRVA